MASEGAENIMLKGVEVRNWGYLTSLTNYAFREFHVFTWEIILSARLQHYPARGGRQKHLKRLWAV